VVLASVNNQKNPPVTPKNSTVSLMWTSAGLLLLGTVLSTEEFIARRKEARQNFLKRLDSITVQPFKRY
jgi:hypothetical protein